MRKKGALDGMGELEGEGSFGKPFLEGELKNPDCNLQVGELNYIP